MLPASRGDPRYFAEGREGLLSSARLLMGSIEVCGLIGSKISRRRDAKLSAQERFDNKTKLLVSLLTIGAFFLVLLLLLVWFFFLLYFPCSLQREIILPSATRSFKRFSGRGRKNKPHSKWTGMWKQPSLLLALSLWDLIKDSSLAIYGESDLSVVIQNTERVEHLLHDGA